MRLLIFILLLAIHPAAHAATDELGRLFFTAQKRLQLEQELAHGSADEDAASITLELNGIVQQQHGTRTVWINGVPKNSVPGKQLATETVIVPGKSHGIALKVGEKVLLAPPDKTLITPE